MDRPGTAGLGRCHSALGWGCDCWAKERAHFVAQLWMLGDIGGRHGRILSLVRPMAKRPAHRLRGATTTGAMSQARGGMAETWVPVGGGFWEWSWSSAECLTVLLVCSSAAQAATNPPAAAEQHPWMRIQPGLVESWPPYAVLSDPDIARHLSKQPCQEGHPRPWFRWFSALLSGLMGRCEGKGHE
jgi:hypothetical protein